MMNKLVEVKEMNLVGKIYDYNQKFVWIETTEDIYQVKIEKVTEVVEAAEASEETAFEAALDAAGLKWDGVVDGDREFSYIIEGAVYDIMVNLDFENNEFYMDTTHKGMEKEETEWKNKKSFKKLNTIIKNVIKWADK